jgi:hypothetical protein
MPRDERASRSNRQRAYSVFTCKVAFPQLHFPGALLDPSVDVRYGEGRLTSRTSLVGRKHQLAGLVCATSRL